MHITMPKRKRAGSEAAASDAEGVEGAVSIRQHRVQHKLDYAHKQLARAFKTAKGFEAQKSGRRRKTAGAKSDAKEVARIEAETAALKVGRSLTYLFPFLLLLSLRTFLPHVLRSVTLSP